jgi:hypothetical protein
LLRHAKYLPVRGVPWGTSAEGKARASQGGPLTARVCRPPSAGRCGTSQPDNSCNGVSRGCDKSVPISASCNSVRRRLAPRHDCATGRRRLATLGPGVSALSSWCSGSTLQDGGSNAIRKQRPALHQVEPGCSVRHVPAWWSVSATCGWGSASVQDKARGAVAAWECGVVQGPAGPRGTGMRQPAAHVPARGLLCALCAMCTVSPGTPRAHARIRLNVDSHCRQA